MRSGLLVLACCVLAGAAYAGLTATVSCTGTGVQRPSLTCLPASLVFGEIPTDSTVVRVVTLKNTGGGTLTGTIRPAPDCGPGYSILNAAGVPVASLPYSLAGGVALVVSVRFAPVTPGPQVCVLAAGP